MKMKSSMSTQFQVQALSFILVSLHYLVILSINVFSLWNFTNKTYNKASAETNENRRNRETFFLSFTAQLKSVGTFMEAVYWHFSLICYLCF